MEVKHRIYIRLRLYLDSFKSFILGVLNYKKFKNLKKFVLFIGYPRSGHTLIASLLDAHPHAIIANEWMALQYMKLGFKKKQIFYSIFLNSQKFSKQKNNIWTGYSYKVEGLYQGNLEQGISILGDKSAGRTAQMIQEDPEIITQFEKIIEKPIYFLHIIRNPYDIITTMTKRIHQIERKKETINEFDLLPQIRTFYNRVSTVAWMKEQSNIKVLDLYHEDFIYNPKTNLIKLLEFLDLQHSSEYLDKCAKIVEKSPHKSRFEIFWPNDLIHFVQEYIINKYKFLQSYTFEN